MQTFPKIIKPRQMNKSMSCNNQFVNLPTDPTQSPSINQDVIFRSNSEPFHKHKVKLKKARDKNDQSFDNSIQDIKIPLMPICNKVSDSYQSRKSSNSSKQSYDSELEKTIKTTSSIQKWNKLRNVMTLTTAMKPKKNLERQDSFIKKFTTQRGIDNDFSQDESQCIETENVAVVKTTLLQKFIIDPKGGVMCIWLSVVTIAVLYNLWTCIARQAFTEILYGFKHMWIVLDILADIIYIFDIAVQLRTSYLERGLSVTETRKLAKRYMKSRDFIVDLVTLVPLDLIQFYYGFRPLLRFPRFLKVYRAWKWKVLMENRTIFPNMWRVINLTHILFLGCHWFAAFYFLISQHGGFESHWGYPKPTGDSISVTRKYLKSFYWSMLTLTTIGDLPPPEKNWEYVFTIVSYLIGVFVFATIVGQVGNVITNRNANRLEFESILDNAKNYMRVHNVPKDLQRRVMRWYDYAWSRGRTSGCNDIGSLALLPDKLKTEMALHVNLETLKKVTIFQECRPEFLHDLVLKMRPFIFTPGDLICRKGEVAREMFIISDGVLEVISDSGDVLKKMGSGDFFGEIGILNLDGGVNRRTADVKSVGYAELFVLSKEDVLSALKDHPDAEKLIVKYGTNRLIEMKDRRFQRIIKNKPPMTGPDSVDQSLDKSENNSLLTIENMSTTNELKQAEIQSLSVFKNIFNKIKFNRHNNIGTIGCNHLNQNNGLPPNVDRTNMTCEDCAIAKLANEITRESVVASSMFNHHSNSQSRLSSVPSIVCQNDPQEVDDVNETSQWLKSGIKVSAPWKQSLLTPKSFVPRRQSDSNFPLTLTDESERKNSIDNHINIAMPDRDSRNEFNLPIRNSINRIVKNHSEKNINKASPMTDDKAHAEQNNSELPVLSEADTSLMVKTFESIFSEKMTKILQPLQSELKSLQNLCSSQEAEIIHLKDTIDKLSSN